jgi:3'(2'), 5'-bisphosphate nucleotidase
MDLKELLNTAITAAEHASADILKIYESEDFDTELKGDLSPLTKADKKGHETIMYHLEKTRIPVLSEEVPDHYRR